MKIAPIANKGGVGKTTLCLRLHHACRQTGHAAAVRRLDNLQGTASKALAAFGGTREEPGQGYQRVFGRPSSGGGRLSRSHHHRRSPFCRQRPENEKRLAMPPFWLRYGTVMCARPKIYQFTQSPFCIAVIQALRAGGIEPELVHVPNADRSELIRLTNGAYYQVPVLVDGERLVYESGADSQDVAAYLDEHYLGGRLFPAPTRGWQWIVNRYLEHEVEDVTFKVCDAAVIPAISDVVERTLIIRHKERKFGPGCVERWGQERASLLAEATRLLFPFEQSLAPGGPFLFGTAPVYSDFLLFGLLGNLTFRNAAPFPAGLLALKTWYDRLRDFRYY